MIVDEQLMKAAKLDLCAERDKCVIILMDEMHIKEGIMYDKHTGSKNSYTYACLKFVTHNAGSITGFVELGDINSHISALEKQIDGDGEESEVANSMLVLFVRGLFSNLCFVYAQFPCTSVSGNKMYDPL